MVIIQRRKREFLRDYRTASGFSICDASILCKSTCRKACDHEQRKENRRRRRGNLVNPCREDEGYHILSVYNVYQYAYTSFYPTINNNLLLFFLFRHV